MNWEGNVIALFSPLNALELFYLCKVEFSGTATEDLHDGQHHIIKEGSPYLSIKYYEKKPNSEFSENKHIIYKMSKVKGPVYVLPAQVMSPQVNVTFIGTDIHLSMNSRQHWTVLRLILKVMYFLHDFKDFLLFSYVPDTEFNKLLLFITSIN